MPTATISQDGQYRINMRVTFRVSIGDLTTYLASSLRHIDDLDQLADLLGSVNANWIQDAVRTEMERRGLYTDAWADQFGYDETVQRLALAERHVRRAFPELHKADREQKQTAAPVQEPAPIEAPAPATCRHGNTPRPDVTGNPIKACDDGFNAPGHVEFGAFNPEGCFYSGDGCAVDAANAAAQDAETEDDITWGRICTEHDGEPDNHCQGCNTEEPEQDPETVAEIHASRCTECKGAGCHWCYWTGQKDA